MIAHAITWMAMLGLNAALGLHIAPYARPAGWVAFGCGSLLWVTFVTSLLLWPGEER